MFHKKKIQLLTMYEVIGLCKLFTNTGFKTATLKISKHLYQLSIKIPLFKNNSGILTVYGMFLYSIAEYIKPNASNKSNTQKAE